MLEGGRGWGQSPTGSIISYTSMLGGSWKKAGCTHGSDFFSSPTAALHDNKLKIQHIFSWCYSSRQAWRSHTGGDRTGAPALWSLETEMYIGDGDAHGHT